MYVKGPPDKIPVVTGARTPEEWAAIYGSTRRLYEDFADKLEALFIDLLRHEGIDTVQLEARAKKVDSFLDKLIRKKEKYTDPLVEVTDLCGVRIITYYKEDVDRVGTLLTQQFALDTENSEDKVVLLDPDRFGYASVHYVAELPAERAGLPEWDRFRSLKFEIQVRTAVQHAWAAVEHKLNYKQAEEVPRDLKRRLSRLSALFELADEQFSDLRDARRALHEDYRDRVRVGDLRLTLDAQSLKVYFDASPKPGRAIEVAQRAGFGVDDNVDATTLQRDRRDLLSVLRKVGITTIQQFDATLDKVIASGAKRFEPLKEEFGSHDVDWVDSRDSLLTIMVLLARAADSDVALGVYRPAVAEALRRVQDAEEERVLDHVAKSKLVPGILDLARAAGWRVVASEELEPSDLERDRRDLVDALKLLAITTPEDLDSAIKKVRAMGKAALAALRDAFEAEGISAEGSPDDILTLLLMLGHGAESAVRKLYKPSVAAAFSRAYLKILGI